MAHSAQRVKVSLSADAHKTLKQLAALYEEPQGRTIERALSALMRYEPPPIDQQVLAALQAQDGE